MIIHNLHSCGTINENKFKPTSFVLEFKSYAAVINYGWPIRGDRLSVEWVWKVKVVSGEPLHRKYSKQIYRKDLFREQQWEKKKSHTNTKSSTK